MEAVLTITPRSPSSPGSSFAIAAAARRIMLKVPTRLMFTAFANVSRRCGPSRPATFSEGAMPAQFTRPCRWPKTAVASSTAALPSFSLVTSVESKAGSFAQFVGQGFASGAIHIGDDDKSAFGNQKPRRRSAQPRCAAGNKEDMILDLHGKLLSSPKSRAQHITARLSVIILDRTTAEANALEPSLARRARHAIERRRNALSRLRAPVYPGRSRARWSAAWMKISRWIRRSCASCLRWA